MEKSGVIKFAAGLVLMFAMSLQANSQTQVGLRLGLNGSRVAGSAVREVQKTGLGYNAGLYAKLNFDGVSIQTELVASGRNYTFTQGYNVGTNNLTAERKIKATYLDVPLLITVELTKDINFLAGPQFSINVGNDQSTGADSISTGYNFKWYEIGLTAGLNYVFNSGIDLTVRGLYGLTPVFTKSNANLAGEEDPNIKNLLLQFTIGLPISAANPNEPDRSSYKTIY